MSSGSVVTLSGSRIGSLGIVRPFQRTPFRKNSFHCQSGDFPRCQKNGPRIVRSIEFWNSATRKMSEVSIMAV